MKTIRKKSTNWTRAALTLLLVMLTAANVQAEVEESQVTILKAIKSTGEQVFNTVYTHKANTRVELDCEVTKNSQRKWEALFGGRFLDFRYNAFVFFSRANGGNVACFSRSGNETSASGFVYDERIRLVCENQTATWYKYSNLSTAAGSVTSSGSVDDGKTPMFLFDVNTANTVGDTQADGSRSVMTLYGCKIYEGTTLKCDFVPAKYNNVVGLYDRVNKTFSGSMTTTAFQAVELSAAELQADYQRALNTIENGQKYRVFTQMGDKKYYVTANGTLSANVGDAPLFCFQRVTADTDKEYGSGFLLTNGNVYFTNPSQIDGSTMREGHLSTRTNNPRYTWEAQVFFLNEEGKFAIRSTNAKSGFSPTEWFYVGRAFWTVNPSADGPLAEYSFDMNYVWQIEKEKNLSELLTNGQCNGTYDGWTKTDGGDGWDIGDDNGVYFWASSYEECKLTQTVTLSDFGISEADIDNEKVICVASAEMKTPTYDDYGRGASENNVKVDMIDANGVLLASVMVLDDLGNYADWTSFATKPFSLFTGTRKLRYTVRGQDAVYWEGQYGPLYRNLSLKYEIGSQGGIGYDEPYTGKVLVDGLYYNLDGETKTAEVTYGDDDYNSYSGKVDVPGEVTFRGTDYTVTAIGEEAFYGCMGLTAVTIPNSVTTIGGWAFMHCSSLTSFTISQNVTKIGVNPFAGCDGLYSLSVESGNAKYDSRDGCNAIIETESNTLIAGCKVTIIPNTVKTIGQEGFRNITKITSFVIPEGVEAIEYGAFAECYGLVSIDIANSVTVIDSDAFYGCVKLSEVTLPHQLEAIGQMAFYGCEDLTEIILPESLKVIGSLAFCYTGINKIVSKMTEPCQLGSYVFYDIYDTATLSVPEGATSNYQQMDNEWSSFSNIVEEVTYNVWLGVTQVTSHNKNDVLGDGTVSYTPGEDGGTLIFTTTTPHFEEPLFGNNALIRSYESLTIKTPGELVIESQNAHTCISTNADLTIYGNVKIVAPHMGINSGGDLAVTGDVDIYITKNTDASCVYAYGNAYIGGNVRLRALAGAEQCLKCWGDITICGDAEMSGARTGINANGNVNFVSGRWDISGDNNSISGKKLTIPEPYSIMLPEGGSFRDQTVCDADGNVANHAVIGKLGIGDINGNTVLDADDVQLLVDYITGKISVLDINLDEADVNGDGEVNITDVTQLINMIIN